ncbi:MAG TPA: hypothetical protein VKV74_05065 [Bryobacteraceae bacterium]|nr:hypothetical protein [Bryobacteraceae bacterium]
MAVTQGGAASQRLRKWLRGLLLAACLVSGTLTVARAWIGPYSLVNSPLNAESAFAVGALLLLASCGTGTPPNGDDDPGRSRSAPWLPLGIALLVAATYSPALSMPLLYDDYSHTDKITRAGTQFWKDQFLDGRSGFFRPLGMYLYRLDTNWAGRSPVLWRLDNVALHALNAALMFLLGRRLGLAAWTAAFAALLFAWHGSRPEAVGWVAARFDLLAAAFVFAGLLLLFCYAERPRAGALCASLAMCVCGLLSKEEAFAFPVLVNVLLWKKISWRVLGAFYGVTAAVFLYRWKVLRGIGGYLTTAGEPTIFIFSAARTAKALFMRLWAVLWFPIDWATEPGFALAIGMTLMLGAWIWLLHTRAPMYWPALGFTIAAALPVQHLLLIGPDLEKSRVLYLPAVGFALLVAFALERVRKSPLARVAAAAILAFHLGALAHNLAIWKRVSAASRSACQQVGAAIQQAGRDATVTGLPNVKDGVYFLRNGFPECVEWNTGVSQWRVHVADKPDEAHSGGVILKWDNSVSRFIPLDADR